MSTYKSDFLRVLAERGFIHQLSDAEGLDARASACISAIFSPS
jgi:tyrosyl-tRNA synthetase